MDAPDIGDMLERFERACITLDTEGTTLAQQRWLRARDEIYDYVAGLEQRVEDLEAEIQRICQDPE